MYSYDEIYNNMKDKFTSLAGYSPDDASDIGIRMKVLAGEIFSVSSAVDWLKMQTFAQSAQGFQLDLRAQERGIYRKKAVQAEGKLTFKISEPLWFNAAVPKGTVCSTVGDNPVRYITTEAGILESGKLSVEVPAAAEKGGQLGNTERGTVTLMITPVRAFESVVNEQCFRGGEDSESDSKLRKRLMKSYENISNGTNAAFYREKALQYDGVYSAGVIPRENGTGTVSVYLGGRGGIPSDDTISKVRTELNRLKEVNVDIKVEPAQTVPVNIDIVVAPKDMDDMQETENACINAVTNYFRELSVGEPVILTALGVQIFNTGKIKNYIFNSSVTKDRKINKNQLAVCEKIKIGQYSGG